MAEETQPVLSDLIGRALKRLVRRSRTELSKAAEASRSHLALRQQQADLVHFWGRLGKTAYHLVQAGEIDHPALRKAMIRIDELEAQIDALRAADAEGSPLPPPEAMDSSAPLEGL
jgi:hypothetical protein